MTFERKVIELATQVERLETRIAVLEATLRAIKRLSPENYDTVALPMINLVLSKEATWAP